MAFSSSNPETTPPNPETTPPSSTTTSFPITTRVLEILEVLQGTDISTQDVQEIIRGNWDLLKGFVVAQNFTSSHPTPQITPSTNPPPPSQITLRTEYGTDFVFTNDDNFVLDASILTTIGDASLLNRKRDIYVRNLFVLYDRLSKAEENNLPVAIVYSRFGTNAEIKLCSIGSSRRYHASETYQEQDIEQYQSGFYRGKGGGSSNSNWPP